jgi:hypothetical protein
MRKVWGLKRWSGFGKGGHASRALTSQQPSGTILRYAVGAAAGEYGKSVVMAGRIVLSDQERGDGYWDIAALRILGKRV